MRKTCLASLVCACLLAVGPSAHAEESNADPRHEERTYTTLPEWYIVFSAQEYAEFVNAGGRPSQFPFFGAISQYNEIEQAMIAAAGGEEKVDDTTRTVLTTIRWSFAFEYGVLGIYENTIGRVTEWFNFLYKSPEDRTADRIASEYGAFLNHTPWYAFPYTGALGSLWTTFDWNSLWVRGIERRVAFTLGYGGKAIYGGVIGYLSKSALGSAGLTTHVTVRGVSVNELSSINGVTEVTQNEDGTLSAIFPRYRAFTESAKELFARGGSFVTIQEHDTVMLSYVSSVGTTCDGVPGEALLHMAFPTDASKERVAWKTEMASLKETFVALGECGVTVEHIYDY